MDSLGATTRFSYDVREWFNMTTSLLDRHLEEGRGDRPAIYSEDRSTTYAALSEAVNRAGNLLHSIGVAREQRVMLLLPDSPALVVTFLAAMRIGAIPVPLNTRYSAEKLQHCIADARAHTLVVHMTLLPLVSSLRASLPDLEHVVVVGAAPSESIPPHSYAFEQGCAAASPVLEPAVTHRDDPAYWLYTSGTTTGIPKAAVHLHGDMVHCVGRWIEAMGLPLADDIVYSIATFPFSYGLVNSLYAPFLTGAAVAIDPRPFAPDHVAETLVRHRPTRLYGSPVHYARLLDACENEEITLDLSSVRTCLSAGEALPTSLYTRWQAHFGLELLDGIGSSECGYIYIQNRARRSRPGTSGELIFGYEVELRGEDGTVVPVGAEGELCLKSPSTAIGYWRRREQTRETFLGPWLKTGDIYTQDVDGYFAYRGRVGDVFKVNGQYVSALEVEEVLRIHAAVMEAAVIGVPDAEGFTKPRAFVVVAPGHIGCANLDEELKQHCLAHFASEPHKYPREIVFIKELPRTENGKVQRAALREWQLEHAS